MAGEKKTKTIDERMFEAMLAPRPRIGQADAPAEMPLEARVAQLERFGTMMFEWCQKLEARLNARAAN